MTPVSSLQPLAWVSDGLWADYGVYGGGRKWEGESGELSRLALKRDRDRRNLYQARIMSYGHPRPARRC
jgi:hypothetical protein